MAKMTFDEVRAYVAEAVKSLRTENDLAFTDVELDEFRQLASQHGQRLDWGPAIGNGAAILALAGIVGNVPNPDVALMGLTWPLAIFSLGLAAGVLGVFLKVEVLEQLSELPRRLRRIRARTLSVMAETERLVEKLTLENADDVVGDVGKLPSLLEPDQKQLKDIARRTKQLTWILHIATVGNAVAISTIALGFMVLLVGHSMGCIRLER
jgi:hypothetical protein